MTTSTSYFYPRPPRGGRLSHIRLLSASTRFLSTPSARRATRAVIAAGTRRADFYPRPPRGGRRFLVHVVHSARQFLSTPSARRATQLSGQPQSRGAISIHALREEGDTIFLPTAPQSVEFLSTPSARRATSPLIGTQISASGFLSTPSARRATLGVVHVRAQIGISIHALREEGDAELFREGVISALISIHALREEGDAERVVVPDRLKDFYPRPPRGGRQQKQRQNLYFQTNCTTFCTNLEEP